MLSCHDSDEISNERFKVMERKLFYGIMTPGMIITFIFGIWMLLIRVGTILYRGLVACKTGATCTHAGYHYFCGVCLLILNMTAINITMSITLMNEYRYYFGRHYHLAVVSLFKALHNYIAPLSRHCFKKSTGRNTGFNSVILRWLGLLWQQDYHRWADDHYL